jgi:hypothetical protein
MLLSLLSIQKKPMLDAVDLLSHQFRQPLIQLILKGVKKKLLPQFQLRLILQVYKEFLAIGFHS